MKLRGLRPLTGGVDHDALAVLGGGYVIGVRNNGANLSVRVGLAGASSVAWGT
jgi:hypothetical protein